MANFFPYNFRIRIQILMMGNKGIAPEREASIAEIHAQSASLSRRDRCDRRDRKFIEKISKPISSNPNPIQLLDLI